MATLEKIRSKGPLLLIVIGLALFAFIAGDLTRVFQPKQKVDAGEVNGKVLPVNTYSAMVEEYSDIYKFTNNLSTLTDDQTTQIKDYVWNNYVQNQLISEQASKIGLTVTKQEIENIIEQGTHPMLQQVPFFKNQQTQQFDKDELKTFLANYLGNKLDPQYMPYFSNIYKFWVFFEKNMMQSLLAQKYNSLISNSINSNPIEAQAAYDARVNQADLLFAAIPYSSIADSTIQVKKSELTSYYDSHKEQYLLPQETRNIQYVEVKVTPSEADKAALLKEVTEYSNTLQTTSEYANFIRQTASEQQYHDVFYTANAYSADVKSRLDTTAVGKMTPVFYTGADNSYNVFKVIDKQTVPDSVQFRQIQVMAATADATKKLADSIYTAIKGGADFATLATKYATGAKPGEANWMTTNQFENQPLDANNLKFINTVYSLGANEMATVDMGQGYLVLQVLNRKAMTPKYKVALVKRPIVFSNETYTKAYNDFSQFMAQNTKIEDIKAKVEAAGYRLQERTDFSSAEHTIAGIKGTKEAIRWIFKASKGDVSPLYECGNNDQLLLVSLDQINEKGYRSVESVEAQLRANVVKEKKAAQIIASMSSKGAKSLNDYKAMPFMVTDTVKQVSFAAPAYVSVLRSSEPVLGACASVSKVNQLSAPIKGNSGVFVFEVYKTEKSAEAFDLKKEQASSMEKNSNAVGRFMQDLFEKAKISDDRYLFF